MQLDKIEGKIKTLCACHLKEELVIQNYSTTKRINKVCILKIRKGEKVYKKQ